MNAQIAATLAVGGAAVLVQVVAALVLHAKFTGEISARMNATDQRVGAAEDALDKFKAQQREEQDEQWKTINKACQDLSYMAGKINGRAASTT